MAYLCNYRNEMCYPQALGIEHRTVAYIRQWHVMAQASDNDGQRTEYIEHLTAADKEW